MNNENVQIYFPARAINSRFANKASPHALGNVLLFTNKDYLYAKPKVQNFLIKKAK